jgi:hypothetical protein
MVSSARPSWDSMARSSFLFRRASLSDSRRCALTLTRGPNATSCSSIPRPRGFRHFQRLSLGFTHCMATGCRLQSRTSRGLHEGRQWTISAASGVAIGLDIDRRIESTDYTLLHKCIFCPYIRLMKCSERQSRSDIEMTCHVQPSARPFQCFR